jgi:hypothetical protein
LSLNSQEKIQISEDNIQILTFKLKTKNIRLKEVALLELGNIGLPEA